jgi:hypothetical protein
VGIKIEQLLHGMSEKVQVDEEHQLLTVRIRAVKDIHCLIRALFRFNIVNVVATSDPFLRKLVSISFGSKEHGRN